MRLAILLSNIAAVFAAFNAGRYVEVSNFAFAAQEPAVWDGVIGVSLMLLATVLAIVPTVGSFDD